MVLSRLRHGRFAVTSWSDDGPPTVTRRTRHGSQLGSATGVSRGLNTSLSLSTLDRGGLPRSGVTGEPPLNALPRRAPAGSSRDPVDAFRISRGPSGQRARRRQGRSDDPKIPVRADERPRCPDVVLPATSGEPRMKQPHTEASARSTRTTSTTPANTKSPASLILMAPTASVVLAQGRRTLSLPSPPSHRRLAYFAATFSASSGRRPSQAVGSIRGEARNLY
jgi:hypothetical protein